MNSYKRPKCVDQWWIVFVRPHKWRYSLITLGSTALFIISMMHHVLPTSTRVGGSENTRFPHFTSDRIRVHGTIYYQERCCWEVDYVLRDLLWDVRHWTIKNFSSTDELSKVFKQGEIQPNVIVYNDDNMVDMYRVIDNLQPKVLIRLSDEDGRSPQHMELAARVPLMLHQYRHGHYPYRANVFQIPLGYIAGFLDGSLSTDRPDTKPVLSRTLQWSFVGTLKQDRASMIASFKATLNMSFYVSHKDSPARIFEKYKNSLFVPNGRGNVVLDCFRLYEASLSGAIPVVVGSWSEVREAFYFNGDLPPWIFEESWEAAATRCKDLSVNHDLLQHMQQEQIQWWSRQILKARERIRHAIVT